MLTYFRYALATFCFAASVGCLELWGWSITRAKVWDGVQLAIAGVACDVETCNGTAAVQIEPSDASRRSWAYNSHRMSKASLAHFSAMIDQQGRFGTTLSAVYFPLWYPALIFALAGVAALRLGNRFTLRAAIIATTVVAGLLGMAVWL